ncbi:MAG: SLBB domain-containing protein [Bdellovibrio sp.]
MNLKQAVRFAMACLMTSVSVQTVQAQELNLLGDIKAPQQASEYIFRSSPKESLIAVQLLGAVNKPGIYYVPANTDLLKLITLAGGTTNGGDLSEILVRKMEPKTWAEIQSKAINEYQGAYEVDAEKLIKYGGARGLKLQQDDFVYVPPRTPWVSNEAARGITVVSVLLGIALTAILIDKNSGN